MENLSGMSARSMFVGDFLNAVETDPNFARQAQIVPNNVPPVNTATMIRPQTAPWIQPQPQIYPTAHIEILEQPTSKPLRFRYVGEDRITVIPGVNTCDLKRTSPGIKIVGYKGPAVVVVSCVTAEPPYRPHPHHLAEKNKGENCKDGIFTIKINSENMTVFLDKVGLQCTPYKNIESALQLRESIKVDPFQTGFEHADFLTKKDMYSVRLCFQAFLPSPNSQKFKIPLQPVVTNPIHTMKTDLVISKLSHCAASVEGGTEVILLCHEVDRLDIEVRFFELRDGRVYWESKGDFLPPHVHKKVAITFKTPKYITQKIKSPVTVFIQLRQPSNDNVSEPRTFQFLPVKSDEIQSRRKKRPRFDDSLLKQFQANNEKNPDAKNQVVTPQKFMNLTKSQPRSNPFTFGDLLNTRNGVPLPPLISTRNVNSIRPNLAGLKPIDLSIQTAPPQLNRYNVIDPRQNLQRPQNLEQLPKQTQVVQKPAPPKIDLANNMVRNDQRTDQPQIPTHTEMNAANVTSSTMNTGNPHYEPKSMTYPSSNNLNFSVHSSDDLDNLSIYELASLTNEFLPASGQSNNAEDSFTSFFNQYCINNVPKNDAD